MKFQESYFHNEYGLSCVEDYIIYILCKDTSDWPKIFYKSYYDIEEILNYLLFEGQEYSSIKFIERIQTTLINDGMLGLIQLNLEEIERIEPGDIFLMELKESATKELLNINTWRRDHYIIERENQRLDSSYNTPFAVKEAGFNMIDVRFGIIGRIKLGNLIKIFPIDKTYDGDKWGCKDYFFTMDVLKEKGLDNAVGRDGVFDLMWDYENRDLREFTVFYMSCMSAMYKQQTGVGIAEKFCEDNGIGTYTMDRENGLVIDNQSGEIAKVSNKPSFMSVVK